MSDVDLFGNEMMKRSADFPAPDIRRSLTRNWGERPHALVIGCNPSDAGADREDNTTRWLNAWFKLFGFGGYTIMNLWAKVSPHPAICKEWADWESHGPDWYVRDEIFYHNLPALVAAAKGADQVFVCWGAIAWDEDFVEHAIEEIQTGVEPWPDLWCWGTTKSGAPKHPMARGVHRIPRDQPPILWRSAR